MKIAIIEVDHFQYGLTISELFEEHERIFFAIAKMEEQMRAYNPQYCEGQFIGIESVANDVFNIIQVCQKEKIEALFINPIFDSFPELLKIVKTLTCKKIITIHNWNYWLSPYWLSPRGWKEKQVKKQIVLGCDAVFVEDFMYAYLTQENPKLSKGIPIYNVPFTLFHSREKQFQKLEDDINLRIVLTGSIHKERRRYEDILEIIHTFAKEKQKITFSFAGTAIGKYGLGVIESLQKAMAVCPWIARYYEPNEEISPNRFRQEMEEADIVLSTSTTKFRALGKTEYIGKTKPTAAIQDMLSFELPGLMPTHLKVPENLLGSVFNYQDKDELMRFLTRLINNRTLLANWKEKARENSKNYSKAIVRASLPNLF